MEKEKIIKKIPENIREKYSFDFFSDYLQFFSDNLDYRFNTIIKYIDIRKITVIKGITTIYCKNINIALWI